MHWNTVSIAKAKLSKLVMPPFGPTQPLLHSVPLAVHWRPFPENAHGAGSSSAMISANRARRLHYSRDEQQENQGWGSQVPLPGTPYLPSLLSHNPTCPSRSTSHSPCSIGSAISCTQNHCSLLWAHSQHLSQGYIEHHWFTSCSSFGGPSYCLPGPHTWEIRTEKEIKFSFIRNTIHIRN